MTWPLVAIFVVFPLWWALGLSAFIWSIVAVPMAVALVWRRRSQAPVATVLWFAFVSWVLLSGVQLDSLNRIITFSYRFSLYLAAAVLFLYVYNMPRSSWLDVKALRILTIFWIIVVIGGYAGLILGSHTFTPPLFHLLPHKLRTNPFVEELVLPVMAEVQKFLGFPIPRPAAPFGYTNEWGGNMAVLTLVAFAAAAAAGRGLRRKVIIIVLALSVVPMIFSLNRGMFLSLALGIFYMTVRLAVRGRIGALISILAIVALTAIVVALTPLGHLLVSGLDSAHGHSNTTRLSLYQQASAGANASPLFGYGAPQQSTQIGQLAGSPQIGTQGQLWLVLYSNGYPALVLFVGFFLAVLWQTRHARGAVGLWLHTAPLVALVQIPVYGLLRGELEVTMVVAALAYRRCWLPSPEGSALARGTDAGWPVATRVPALVPPPLARPPREPARVPALSLPPAARAPQEAARFTRSGGSETDAVRARLTSRSPGNSVALTPEIGSVARGSVINLVAMVAGALLGFALTVLASRWLQPEGVGALFELIALYTILSNTLELGADTGLLRWISRARAVGGMSDVRRIVAIAVVPVLVIGFAAVAVVWIEAAPIAHVFLRGMAPAAAVSDVRIVAPLLPLGALVAVLVSAARGFGQMWPFLTIQGFGQPAMRLALVAVALVLGWGLRGALIGWGIPVVIGVIVSALILAMLIRREVPAVGRESARSRFGRMSHRLAGSQGAFRQQGLAAEFWRFTAPRGLSGTFQIIVIWLDILLVGALLSRYAAGIYGAVSRLAIIGTFALEGSRLAIGPQLSALLARHQTARAARLHQNATHWLMIASWPFYIIISIFPVVVLGIFGHRYTVGASALTILALAMLVNLGTGNVTVVLLMGGKSSLSAYNALAALIVNVGLNLLLLPHIGIAGAAIAWAASIVVDNVAPMIEVWLMLGIRPFGEGYWLVAITAMACFGVSGIAIRALLGQTLLALFVAAAIGMTAFAVALYAARERLQLGGLLAMMRLRPVRLESTDQRAARVRSMR